MESHPFYSDIKQFIKSIANVALCFQTFISALKKNGNVWNSFFTLTMVVKIFCWYSSRWSRCQLWRKMQGGMQCNCILSGLESCPWKFQKIFPASHACLEKAARSAISSSKPAHGVAAEGPISSVSSHYTHQHRLRGTLSPFRAYLLNMKRMKIQIPSNVSLGTALERWFWLKLISSGTYHNSFLHLEISSKS